MANETKFTPQVPRPLPPTKRPQPALTQKRWVWLAGGITAFAAFSFAAMIALLLMVYAAQPRLPAGTQIAGIAVGDEPLDDAAQTLQAMYATKSILLTDADRRWQVPLAELGITLDTAATLTNAQSAAPNTNLAPVLLIDFSQTQARLINLSAEVNLPPQ
ncbi:MAG: hypothetical protein H7Y11_09310, partial [Armatimonadetes bacterium]|nr:hypothetical protein [Anaerolineae bacterium]